MTNDVRGLFSNGVGNGSEDDVMALTRVNRRLTIVQSELDQARQKLHTNQTSLQVYIQGFSLSLTHTHTHTHTLTETVSKLISFLSPLCSQTILSENYALKSQLEEYKAELSLKSIEVNNNVINIATSKKNPVLRKSSTCLMFTINE